jgi:hypothetical protein
MAIENRWGGGSPETYAKPGYPVHVADFLGVLRMTALARLARGEAAVFGDGDDAPVLVHITGPPQTSPTTSASAKDTGTRPPPRPPVHWGCACTGEDHAAAECVTASGLAEQAEIRQGVLRIATAALRASGGGELSSSELVQAIRRDAAPHDREELVIGCLAARGAEWLADTWGARRSWPFHRTLEFAETLRQLLTDTLKTRARGQDAGSAAGSLRQYQQAAVGLHQRATDPYPSCSAICTGDLAGSCLYRHAVASTLQRPDVLSEWADARTRDQAPEVTRQPSIPCGPRGRQQPLRRDPPRCLLHPFRDQGGHAVIVMPPRYRSGAAPQPPAGRSPA